MHQILVIGTRKHKKTKYKVWLGWSLFHFTKFRAHPNSVDSRNVWVIQTFFDMAKFLNTQQFFL